MRQPLAAADSAPGRVGSGAIQPPASQRPGKGCRGGGEGAGNGKRSSHHGAASVSSPKGRSRSGPGGARQANAVRPPPAGACQASASGVKHHPCVVWGVIALQSRISGQFESRATSASSPAIPGAGTLRPGAERRARRDRNGGRRSAAGAIRLPPAPGTAPARRSPPRRRVAPARGQAARQTIRRRNPAGGTTGGAPVRPARRREDGRSGAEGSLRPEQGTEGGTGGATRGAAPLRRPTAMPSGRAVGRVGRSRHAGRRAAAAARRGWSRVVPC